MSASLVLDCSVAMAWCFADEATKKTEQILERLVEETALVPALWPLEVVNVLTVAERRKRITRTKSAEFLALLETFDFEVDHESAGRAFSHFPPLCREYGLTSYDATYLDLAIRRNLPLATLDNVLRRGAKTLKIELLGK
jgi:predicted nucleic acid-binding protein